LEAEIAGDPDIICGGVAILGCRWMFNALDGPHLGLFTGKEAAFFPVNGKGIIME